MDEHKVGEVVLKETQVQNDAGKQESVINMARGVWGDSPQPADATKVIQPQANDAPALPQSTQAKDAPTLPHPPQAKDTALLPQHLVKDGPHGPAAPGKDLPPPHQTAHHVREQGHPSTGRHDVGPVANPRNDGIHRSGVAPAESVRHVQAKDGPQAHSLEGTQVKDRAHEGQTRHERLVEASHRMKELSNKLSEAGGPLHGTHMELVGFDKSGRLLLIDRDKDNKVAHKYLVDQESGKIVRRTEPGHPEKWEPRAQAVEGGPKAHLMEGQKTIDAKTGAHTTKDNSGHVKELVDGYGDKRSYNRDKGGHVIDVTLTVHGKTEHFKPGPSVRGVSADALWYQQPQNPGEHLKPVKVTVDDVHNSLTISTKAGESTTYGADGSITQHHGQGKDKITRPPYKVEATQPEDTDVLKIRTTI